MQASIYTTIRELLYGALLRSTIWIVASTPITPKRLRIYYDSNYNELKKREREWLVTNTKLIGFEQMNYL